MLRPRNGTLFPKKGKTIVLDLYRYFWREVEEHRISQYELAERTRLLKVKEKSVKLEEDFPDWEEPVLTQKPFPK